MEYRPIYEINGKRLIDLQRNSIDSTDATLIKYV